MGADPCYIAVDKAQKTAFVANYSSGQVTVLPINKDGSLGNGTETIRNADGLGPNKERQEGPHAHMSILSPDEKFLFYNDLGTDRVNIYRFKSGKESPLSPATPSFISVKPGEGPRHLEYSLDKKHVFLATEMGSNVFVFDYDGGKFKQKQVISLLPDGFTGKTAAAAIHLSPDGKFLYVSNRLETNEIICFSVNQETGELAFVSRQSTFGKNPRDFAIDPTGKFLVVANQGSDNMFVFKIDPNTGKLTQTGIKLDIGNPVCLKITPAEWGEGLQR